MTRFQITLLIATVLTFIAVCLAILWSGEAVVI
jgi:hypothetical protein